MIRKIEVETSYYDPRPKRWNYGLDGWVIDIHIEYPPELDGLEDDELLEKADNEEEGVKYVEKE